MPVLAGDSSLPWLVAGVAAVLLIGLVVAALRQGGRGDVERKVVELSVVTSGLLQAQTEVLGRLKQLSDTTAAAQSEQTQVLNARLDAVAGGVRQALETSSLRTAESLGSLQKHLNVIDQAQRNILELSTQVVGLQDLLGNKQARGAFGEIQLNDLVGNILPPGAYELQARLSNGLRPDCLIHMPLPPGSIAIDAKFPLEGYQALRAAAADEPARVRAGREFRTAILRHIRDIAERYILPGETAESALMFLPSEAIYAELHSNFTDVVQESYRHRVWIVSPTTLWALLNTVRAVMKDVQMREQASVIQKEVAVLLGDIQRLDQRVANLQRHFNQAGEDIREIRISTEKVQQRSGRIGDLRLEIPEPADPGRQL
ncbi:MAG: DNA recombination protein RmuC, partial [Alphaproteobacteria bacterium]|nr:DNA recombination protein RmuC [Alphaproteobacteria bacterium]